MEHPPRRHGDTEDLEKEFLRVSVPPWWIFADDRRPTTDDQPEAA
jgi:hypothetical protein